MGLAEEIIAAIELSSSKVAGIAGYKDGDGSLHVLAYAKEDIYSFIPKGVILNVDQTAATIRSVITQLDAKLDHMKITKVYVGLGGLSLHSERNVVLRKMDKEVVVTQELVDSICDENLTFSAPDMDIWEVVPQEYKVGFHKEVLDPVGTTATRLEGNFLNLLAKKKLQRNLQLTFDKLGLPMVERMTIPLSTAKVALTPEERQKGVALVDLGAGTTTVSVYKGGLLRYLAVLPLGGENITKDIESFDDLDVEKIELMKKSVGDALYTSTPVVGKLLDEEEKLSTFNEIIGARAEEIAANVNVLIKHSAYERLSIVLVGGGANLTNMATLIENATKPTKIRVATKPNLKVEDYNNLLPLDSSVYGLLGLLEGGTEHCVEQIKTVEPEQKHGEDGLFDNDPDYNEKSQEELAAEAKERRAKDKEDRKKDGKPNKKNNGPGFLRSLFDKVSNGFSELSDDLS